MAICHYMMVCPGWGEAGGSRLEMARRARRLRRVGRAGPRLGGSIAEIDFDDAHGFEGDEGLRCGEIKTSGLEFLFEGAMQQKRQRRDEDARLHACSVRTAQFRARRSRPSVGAGPAYRAACVGYPHSSRNVTARRHKAGAPRH